MYEPWWLNSSYVLPAKNIGSSWDVKNICPNYKNLTVDNFYIGCSGQSIIHLGFCYVGFNWIKSYDAANGIFKVSLQINKEREDDNWSYSATIQPILIQ